MKPEDIKPGMEFAYQIDSVLATGTFHGLVGGTGDKFVGEICPGRLRHWSTRYIIAARKPRTLTNWFPKWEIVE